MTDALRSNSSQHDESWTNSLAVGSQAFVHKFQTESGARALHRSVINKGEQYQLREEHAAYTVDSAKEKADLSVENTVFLDEF